MTTLLLIGASAYAYGISPWLVLAPLVIWVVVVLYWFLDWVIGLEIFAHGLDEDFIEWAQRDGFVRKPIDTEKE